MNFTDINSPAELVLENERQLSPEERAMMAMAKCGPETHLKLVKVMVEALRDYHREIAMDADNPRAWVVDATRLDEALTILNKVNLD